MQFHIFTITFTIIIYVYLRYNKEHYNADYSMYSLIIPILLYSYKYININSDVRSDVSVVDAITASFKEPTLMTDTYPMSTVTN